MLPDCVFPTIKHRRASLRVWSCFCYTGTGDLQKNLCLIMNRNTSKETTHKVQILIPFECYGMNWIEESEKSVQPSQQISGMSCNVPRTVLEKLIYQMPSILQAVLCAEGEFLLLNILLGLLLVL